jgi:hypothetical protein
MKKSTLTLITIMLFFSAKVTAQSETEVHKYKPLKLNLNEDGSKYLRFIIWNQMQATHNLQTNGNSADDGLNLSIRRSRILAFAQVSPRFMVLSHFGLNSLAGSGLSANPNTQQNNQQATLFLHDAWGEFDVHEENLYVGMGLHYWNGWSRLSGQSTLNMMTLDNPGTGMGDARLFPWASITTSDQFARHMGVYAKGSFGKLNYRASANNARPNVQALDLTNTTMQVAGTGKDWVYTGYANYEFFDKESTKLPYWVGTYMGKKKVLSVGAGVHSQPNALKAGSIDTLGAANYTKEENLTFLAADVFYDAPIGDKGHAINALGAFYQYGFGDNANFSGGGLVPGNGNIIYTQLGYYLPVKDQGIMPYATYSNQNFENTPNSSYELGVGCNYYISGHNAKLTAEYNTGQKGTNGAGTNSRLTLQMHIFL